MRLLSLLLAFLLLSAANLSVVPMTLTDSEGREIQADVLEIRGNLLRFTLEGKPYELPINQLDPATQQELAQLRDSLAPKAKMEMRLRVEAAAAKVRTDEIVRRPKRPAAGEDGEREDDDRDGKPEPSVRTIDYWAYNVAFSNTANLPTAKARVDYRVYAGETTDDPREAGGQAELEPIQAFGRWTGQTPEIRVDEGEKVFGLALRVVAPETNAVLFEWKSPTMTKIDVDWDRELDSETRRPPRPPL